MIFHSLRTPLFLGLCILAFVFLTRQEQPVIQADLESETRQTRSTKRPTPVSLPSQITASREPDHILPPLDHAELLTEARKLEEEGRYLFAKARDTRIAPHLAGNWTDFGNRAQWHFHLRSEGATSLNLAFSQFHLPPDATLTISDATGTSQSVTFTSRDNDAHGQLWTPLFETEELFVSLDIRPELASALRLNLAKVNHGFRSRDKKKKGKAIGDSTSGSCNIDVVCSSADNSTFGPLIDLYRDQIKSVAAYTLSGIETCTGALINNTRNDLTPYFLTADHCGINSSNASSIVVYWNFENSTCRTPNTSNSGANGNGPITQFNSGSIFRAARAESDFCLIELDDPVDPAFGPFYAGWDRSGENPMQTVGIHHPGVSEKRISFELDPTTTTTFYGNSVDQNATHLRVADWDFGTTEGGSSGSPLFDEAGRIIGQLHGGDAACGNNLPDWYGRVSRSWQDGGSPSTQLSNWLDPDNTGALAIDGTYSDQTISIGEATVTEGNSGTTQATITLTLSEATNDTVTVTVRSQPDSATATDFAPVNQQVTFLPGQTTRTISVSINGDTIPEENETILLVLSNPSNAVIGAQPGRINILNDDFVAPVINSSFTAEAFVNSPFEYRISAANTPTSFSLGDEPTGMAIDPVTGIISWIPSSLGSESVTIVATNPAGSDSRTLSLTINSNSLASAIELPPSILLRNGNPGWSRQTVIASDGIDAGKAAAINNGESATFSLEFNGPDLLEYRYKVSSEEGYDFLTVSLDDEEKFSFSGEIDWQTGRLPIPAGSHAVTFSYSKDGSAAAGSDTAWIDETSLASQSGKPVIISPAALIVDAGSSFDYAIESISPEASFSVNGLPDGLQFDNGNNITGTLGTPGDFSFEIIATNNGEEDRLDVELTVVSPVGDSVELTTLPWTRTGQSLWFGQTEQTFDGIDAAQSGAIEDDQSTSMSITITGPDRLSFYWRVSSEEDFDELFFLMDGEPAPGIEPISGEEDWTEVNFVIPSGSHVLAWEYRKDESFAEGDDTAWLDDLRFASGRRPVIIADSFHSLLTGQTSRVPLEFVNANSFSFQNLPDWLGYQRETEELVGIPPSAGEISFTATANGSSENVSRRITFSIRRPDAVLATTLGVPQLPVTTFGEDDWRSDPAASSTAVRSGNIANSQSSTMTAFAHGPGTLRFEWSVSSEEEYDFLSYSLNGTKQSEISGDLDWEMIEIPLEIGFNEISWTYRKDGSTSRNLDLGRVRNITLGGFTEFLTDRGMTDASIQASDDPDGNSLSLFHEYAFLVTEGDTNPSPILTLTLEPGQGSLLALEFEGLPDSGGVEYFLESTTNLRAPDWQPFPVNFQSFPNDSSSTYRLNTGLTDQNQDRLFFRVRARFPGQE